MQFFNVRSFAVAVLVAVAMVVVASRDAAAQVRCPCENVTVAVAADLPCSVHVCQVTPHGTELCYDFAPGTIRTIPCIEGMHIIIVDGCGIRHNIQEGDCFRNIPGPAPCCIDACLNADANGCLTLRMGKGSLAHCFCPGG